MSIAHVGSVFRRNRRGFERRPCVFERLSRLGDERSDSCSLRGDSWAVLGFGVAAYSPHVTLRTWEVLKLLTRFAPKFRSVKLKKIHFGGIALFTSLRSRARARVLRAHAACACSARRTEQRARGLI